MNKSFDELLSDGDKLMKNGMASLLSNLGKAIALITLFVACLVTFTDITFGGFGTKGYFPMLVLMVISSYIMYFSLCDVGEKKGEESEEYISAKERYMATRVKITGEMMPQLRRFCIDYSKAELEYRRQNCLMSYGLATEDMPSSDTKDDKRKKRIFKRVMRMRLTPLSARTLLSCDKKSNRTELSNPERGRFLRSFIKLLPSVVCMCITVSVVLNVKDGMSAADVINGILKLATLPIIGIRGYTSGIFFSSVTKTAWLETKTRILESFLEAAEQNKLKSA